MLFVDRFSKIPAFEGRGAEMVIRDAESDGVATRSVRAIESSAVSALHTNHREPVNRSRRCDRFLLILLLPSASAPIDNRTLSRERNLASILARTLTNGSSCLIVKA